MKPWLALTGLLFVAAAHGQSLQESVTTVWVHDVPGPPQGDFWHPVAEHILSSFTDPASIYPNVKVCVRPLTVATPHCTSVCWEFKGDTLRQRMPACATATGPDFQQCMYTRVLYDDNVALTQGYSCSRQYQDQVDPLARTGVAVWLQGKVCGIGQWIGLKGCQAW